MITIDEFEIMLNELAEKLPQEFYNQLNGGIMLLPEVKLHPDASSANLYIMGEYYRGGSMGRYIAIYYGSFERVYGNLRPDELREQADKVLRHEFTHHIENLAGEFGLEIKDAQNLEKYRN